MLFKSIIYKFKRAKVQRMYNTLYSMDDRDIDSVYISRLFRKLNKMNVNDNTLFEFIKIVPPNLYRLKLVNIEFKELDSIPLKKTIFLYMLRKIEDPYYNQICDGNIFNRISISMCPTAEITDMFIGFVNNQYIHDSYKGQNFDLEKVFGIIPVNHDLI